MTNVYHYSAVDNTENTDCKFGFEDDECTTNVITRIPIVQTNLTASVQTKHASFYQGKVYPLYPLRIINVDSSEDLVINTNSSCDLSKTFKLTGYDAAENGNNNTDVAPYYGFNQSLGQWVIFNENGNDLPDQNSSVISITDKDKLSSKDANGEAYIKYKIKEDCYHTYYENKAHTSNADLIRIPIIKVKAEVGAGFTGPLKVTGDLQRQVGVPIDLSLGTNTLEVYAVDDITGHETLIDKKAIDWYPIETSLQQDPDNRYIFTPVAEGDAHLGISYGGVAYTQGRIKKEYSYPITIVSTD